MPQPMSTAAPNRLHTGIAEQEVVMNITQVVTVGLPVTDEDHALEFYTRTLGLELYHDALACEGSEERLAVLAGLAEFREHLGGELTVTLLRGIGRPIEVHAMDLRLIEEAIRRLRAFANGDST